MAGLDLMASLLDVLVLAGMIAYGARTWFGRGRVRRRSILPLASVHRDEARLGRLIPVRCRPVSRDKHTGKLPAGTSRGILAMFPDRLAFWHERTTSFQPELELATSRMQIYWLPRSQFNVWPQPWIVVDVPGSPYYLQARPFSLLMRRTRATRLAFEKLLETYGAGVVRESQTGLAEHLIMPRS